MEYIFLAFNLFKFTSRDSCALFIVSVGEGKSTVEERKINLSIMNSVFDCDASLGQDAKNFAPKIEVLKSPKIHQSHS